MADKNQVTYIGTTDFRNQQVKFGIKAIDRSRHMYIIGKTGMGKSTVLENLAVQDITNGEGIVFIDPHGSAIEKLLDYVPEHRINDVIYFAPFDTDFPISFNVMEDIDPDKRHLVVNGLMASFKKIWQDAWSARMEYILTNTLLALMETPNSTLLGVNRMYADKPYRDTIIANVTDNAVKAFWLDEFNKWDVKFMREATAAIQNKIGQFTGNPLIRNIIGQEKSSFDFRKAMDGRKIILMNLSKGLIGEENMRLLGGMLITKLYLAAMSRADVGTYALDTLPPCYFFVDEFQNFANESFADILAEARKYKLNLTVANQYIAQMEEVVRDAVFGNVGTTISFRVGPFDAEVLERAFIPVFTQEDMVNIAQFQMYLTLSIDAVGSKPFSAKGLPPIPRPDISFKDAVINASRAQYAQPRTEVEAKIAEWFTPIQGTGAAPDGKKQGASAPFNPNFDAAKASAEIKAKEIAVEGGDPLPKSPAADFKTEAKLQPASQPHATSFKKPEVRTGKPAMSDTLKSLIDQLDKPAAETPHKSASQPAVSVQPKDRQPVRAVPVTSQPQTTIQAEKPSPVTQKPDQAVPLKKQEFARAANEDNRQALRDVLKKVTVPVHAQPSEQSSKNAPTPTAVQKIQEVAPREPAPAIVAEQSSEFTPSVPDPAKGVWHPVAEERPVAVEPGPSERIPQAPVPPSGNNTYSPGQPKEVPEDVLRRILE